MSVKFRSTHMCVVKRGLPVLDTAPGQLILRSDSGYARLLPYPIPVCGLFACAHGCPGTNSCSRQQYQVTLQERDKSLVAIREVSYGWCCACACVCVRVCVFVIIHLCCQGRSRNWPMLLAS